MNTDDELIGIQGPRTATLVDAGKLFSKSVTNVASANQFMASVETLSVRHPLYHLTPVIQYAVQLHSNYLFPWERACSEAFLAVPEADIARAAAEYLRGLENKQSGGDIVTFIKRRKMRTQNAGNYSRHFHLVLVKFATAVNANKSLALLTGRKPVVTGGARDLKTLMGQRVTASIVDQVLFDVVRPFYDVAGSVVTYQSMKEMQRLLFRRLMKVLKGSEVLGEFDASLLKNARRITDMFYLAMCFAVVSVHTPTGTASMSPEARRFVRMYQHTHAYVAYTQYSSVMKLQMSFVDSQMVDILTCDKPEYVQLFTLMGSNVCKHVHGKSLTARAQLALDIIRNSITVVTTVTVLATILTATQGGALVPLLSIVGFSDAALVANIATKIAKSQTIVVNAIHAIVATHKYRVEKRNSSSYDGKYFAEKPGSKTNI